MNNLDNILNEIHNTEVLQRPIEINGQEHRNVETQKTRTNKTAGKRKRVNRKRTFDGEFASGSQNVVQDSEINSSDISGNESEHVEVIDVEKLKDLPLVDLTKDNKNDIYVDLTKELPQTPERIESFLSDTVICISSSKKSQFNSLPENDDIVVEVNNPTRSDNEQDTSDSIACAICMDSLDQIKKAKRQLMSTTCGHVFCNTCITGALSSQQKCPTCRNKVTKRQLHPLFL